MAGIDRGGQPELTPMERVEMLITCGVPEEQLQQQHQEGLLMYLEEHKDKISEVTAAILSASTDLSEASKSTKKDKDGSSSDSGQ